MKAYVYPYNQNSESAKLLARGMSDLYGQREGGKAAVVRIKKEESKFQGGRDKLVINWGCSVVPDEVMKCRVLNSPDAVAICANKLSFFHQMAAAGIARTIPWTEDQEVAKEWIKDGRTVMVRTILNGHSAQGLYVVENEANLLEAKLYTKYINKKEEYRVHVFRGQVFVVQRKAYNNGHYQGANPVNWKVRNLDNGFIFARNEGLEAPKDVLDQAVNAVNSVPGLDFGSVDVIWNEYHQEAYVLEINTASGLTNSTVTDYAKKFKEFLDR